MKSTDVIGAYFDAVRTKDVAALHDLFTADAELVTGAGTFSGPEAIAGFYRDLAFTVDDLWPEPGPLLIDDDRVAVEIRLRMNGSVSLVGDFFTLADGRISRLVIYNGPPVPGDAT
jgi:aldehyde dehydrogenase (NAD+)